MNDCELLRQAADALQVATAHLPEDRVKLNKAKNAIHDRLSQPEWVRVSDALPIVPNGKSAVDLWVVAHGCDFCFPSTFSYRLNPSITHWVYRFNPKPPRAGNRSADFFADAPSPDDAPPRAAAVVSQDEWLVAAMRLADDYAHAWLADAIESPEKEWHLLEAHLRAHPAFVVPEGFALVPIEPTDAMLQAGTYTAEES